VTAFQSPPTHQVGTGRVPDRGITPTLITQLAACDPASPTDNPQTGIGHNTKTFTVLPRDTHTGVGKRGHVTAFALTTTKQDFVIQLDGRGVDLYNPHDG